MADPLGIGLIGANPDRGWAVSSHLPALASGKISDRVRLVAVGTSRQDTADRAAAKTGTKGYADYRALIDDPKVDMVVVSVKLPLHHEIVSAALAAGKHVYCEWPLGRTLAEAEDLAARAEDAGVHTMIGLQSHGSHTLAHFRELLASGYIGEPLSVSVIAAGFGWGEAIEPGNAYLFDADNGATLLTITGGHMIDALIAAFGDLSMGGAILKTRRSQVGIVPLDQLAKLRTFEARLHIAAAGERIDAAPDLIVTHESFRPTSPDQVVVSGLFGDVPLSLHIRGGVSRGSGLLIEVMGTHGELRVTAPAGVLQMMPLQLWGATGATKQLAPIETPADPMLGGDAGLSIIAANVANLYARFADDIRHDRRTVPDFAHALQRQRLLDEIQRAAS